MKNLKDLIFFLDLQTTGAKPPAAGILEMAWGSTLDSEIKSYLIQQATSLPRQIQMITGIKNEDLESAISLEMAFTNLQEAFKAKQSADIYLIIHFAQFEKKFLEDYYLTRQNELPFKIICTHEIAKRLLPNLPTRGIKGLAGYFGFPSQDLKRAQHQVLATQTIWKGLEPLLQQQGLEDPNAVYAWLQEKKSFKKGKYEYPLQKEKRLGLPKQPGIYKMISRWGEVLYVGKATSLHDRVNSYFRGQKNRDSRKLEMLTQVWDLEVTAVQTPLEAALLETDEIKRLNPRYNISLKMGSRELAFYNKDFSSVQNHFDENHFIGPFSNRMTLDSMLRLSRTLRTDTWDEKMFYEPLPVEILEEGFNLFCTRHSFQKNSFESLRSILAVGLNWYRAHRHETDTEDPDQVQEITETDEIEVASEPLEAETLTSEDIADKFERHFIRAARAYKRTKELTKLLNSKVEILKDHWIEIQDGRLIQISAETLSTNEQGPRSSRPISQSWQGHAIETYDRMSILLAELTKIKKSL